MLTRLQHWMLKCKLAALSLFNPWLTVRQLRAENQRLVGVITDPLVTGIKIGNGSLDIDFQGGAPQLIAGMFVGMFEKYPDAKNYIEVEFRSPIGPILVTCQKKRGKTAHQMLTETQAELAALRADRSTPGEVK